MRRFLAGAVVGVTVAGFTVGPAQAQIPFSIVAGPTIANISSEEYETSSKTGFFVAAGVSFPLSPAVSLSPYLAYVKKGTTFDSDDSDGSYDYIEIPLLLELAMPLSESAGLLISAGPAFGFQVKCDEDGFDCTEFGDHKGTEFSFLGSAGVGFPMSETNSFGVGLGFDLGLTNIFEDLDYKTRTIYVFLAYSMLVGG